MAVTAKIKLVQGATTPPAGESLLGTVSVPVDFSNDDDSNVESHEWRLYAVPTASALPVGVVSGSPSGSFSPDVVGGYLLGLIVKDAAGNRATDFRVVLVPEPSGRKIPPFDATAPTLNFGGETEGWHPIMEEWLKLLDSLAGGAGHDPVISLAPSMPAIAKASAAGMGAGDFTWGVHFWLIAPHTCKGVRAWIKFGGGGTKNIKFRVYDPVSLTTLATVTVNNVASDTMVEALFGTPQLLVETGGANAGRKWGVSAYVDDGTVYPNYGVDSGFPFPAPNGTGFGVWMGRTMAFETFSYSAGDAVPATDTFGERYPIEPIFES